MKDPLRTARQKKERGYSVKDCIDWAKKVEDESEDMVVITIDKDGGISYSYSMESTLEFLGHLEILKYVLLKEMGG